MAEIIHLGDGSNLPGVPYTPHVGNIRVDQKARYDQGSIFLAQDIEFLEAGILDDEYEPMAGNDLVATVSNVPPYMKTIRAKRRQVAGVPKWAGIGGKQSDIPQVDQEVTDTTWNQNKLVIGYSYDDDELAASRAMGLSIDVSGASDCVSALNAKMDDFKFNGAPDIGMRGFFDDSGVPRSEADFGFNDNFTPTQILDGMHAFVNAVAVRTNTVERVNRLGLTVTAYHYISRTRMAADTDQTILQAFVGASMYISNESQVYQMVKLSGLAIGPSMVAYTFNPSKCQVNEHAPAIVDLNRVGLSWLVIFVAYISEVQHRKPKAAAVLYNIHRTS